MKTETRTALDRLEDYLEKSGASDMQRLLVTIPPIQHTYEELIQQALQLLAGGLDEECSQLLQSEQENLAPSLERLGALVEVVAASEDAVPKLIVEYLHTRIRMVTELRMSPAFSLELLDQLSSEDSLEKTIYYLETTMIGKGGLYQQLMSEVSEPG